MKGILTNAKLVLANEVVLGTLVLDQGHIQAVDQGLSSLPGAVDLQGDYLLPGLIDMHTDHLEKHIEPRPGVRWPGLQAVLSYEAQLKQAGISTVYDSLCVGNSLRKPERTDLLSPMLQGIAEARELGMLAVDHLLHMRMEITDPDLMTLFAPFIDHADIRLLSIMDHSPGHRQSPDVQSYKHKIKAHMGMSDLEVEEHVDFLLNASRTIGPSHRLQLCELAKARGWLLASHDDDSPEQVALAKQLGMSIAEFPTTLAAAAAAHAQGMATVMGAPNVINGGSHSGNVAAHELAAAGLLDILSSDYVPTSLLQACFLLAQRQDNDLNLAQAVALASNNVAKHLHLADRGRLEVGLRADLLQVRCWQQQAFVKQLWIQGKRQFAH